MDLPLPPASWAPPSIDFVRSALPSLPPIRDPDLARQARTLKSSLSLDADGIEKRELRAAEFGSNERLEWRGDFALDFYISDRLQAMFPRATVGGLSVCSELGRTRSCDGIALLVDISRCAGPARRAHFEPHILALVLALRHPSRAHLQSARRQPKGRRARRISALPPTRSSRIGADFLRPATATGHL